MIILYAHGQRLPSVLLSAIRQDFYAKPVAWTQPSSPDSCTGSTAEPSSLEQAMICLQPGSQTQDSIEIAAERDGVCIATLRRAKFDSGVRSSKTENQAPGRGLCLLRRMSTRRSTRQDAQINYLSTLAIFVKQTTYLARLPNPDLKANIPLSLFSLTCRSSGAL
jgi:hypothetical protein